MAIVIHIQIPDDLRVALGERAPNDELLSRWSLEALVIEAYREGLLSRGKLGELLGLGFQEREAWLKAKNVPYNYDESDLMADQKTLEDLLGA